jgi:alkylated DNA nucleotide flippase Atl1
MSAPLSTSDRILGVVEDIPPGRVMAYGDIAGMLGLASARQVGWTLARPHRDVPWHRVVHSDGTMAGHLRDRQRRLLRSEGVRVNGYRVDMATHRWP